MGLELLIPILGTILTMATSWGLAELSKWVASRTKNENAAAAMKHIALTTETVVKGLTQSVAKYYKEQNVDGKLNKDQRDALKNMAIAKVKAQVPLSVKALSALAIDSLDDLISSQVERVIHDGK